MFKNDDVAEPAEGGQLRLATIARSDQWRQTKGARRGELVVAIGCLLDAKRIDPVSRKK